MAPGPELNDTTLRLTAPDSQLRILAEAIPQMVYTADALGNLQYANKRWYEYTGLTYDQTRNLHCCGLFIPTMPRTTRLTWQAAVKSGDVYEISHRLRRAMMFLDGI